MSFSERLSSADLQSSAFSRRNMLGKFFATTVATAAAKRSHQPHLITPITAPSLAPLLDKDSSPSHQPHHSPAPSKYPVPEFNIGDLVAYDWEPDDDDAPESATDFGEILGMRWIPEPDGYCPLSNTWVYFVRWTHSSCPGCLPEPYSDGELTLPSDLRLVNPA
jgi:hypothetical protein